MLVAYILRQGKIPLGLGHIADVETQCSKAVITRKKHLRLACFSRHLQCLIVTACRELRLRMALMDLSKNNERDRQMLALVECAV